MTVHTRRRYHPSARLLGQALERAGYTGRNISWGHAPERVLRDRPGQRLHNAMAGRDNKRRALLKMAEAGVPTPKVYRHGAPITYPVVGRPDQHRAGQGFYLCHNNYDRIRASRQGATHFMEFIEDAREFRVHVAFEKSIKIAEKAGGDGHIRNTQHGWYFEYPQDFNHKQSLRRVAKEAVKSLGLDFGAVDVLYSNGNFYVLEVNTAPSLTSRSDTLDRYVKAFMENQ